MFFCKNGFDAFTKLFRLLQLLLLLVYGSLKLLLLLGFSILLLFVDLISLEKMEVFNGIFWGTNKFEVLVLEKLLNKDSSSLISNA